MITINFKPGDIIEFCNDLYFVIDNYGKSGLVCPIGSAFYVEFQWGGCNFIRQATEEELTSLSLI